MIVQPISIRQPEIHALYSGRLPALIRPLGKLAVMDPGDLLWVREPFYLPKLVDHLAPTVAAGRGEVPVYAVDEDIGVGKLRAIGRRRNARELPKAWHRAHLRITEIVRVQLHDVALADIEAAGWNTRAAFKARWDDSAGFYGGRANKSAYWDANPPVLRIAFDRVLAPIPLGGRVTIAAATIFP